LNTHAEASNSPDAKLFQARHAGRIRLRAAVKMPVDHAKVGDAMSGRHPAIFRLTEHAGQAEQADQNRQDASWRASEKHASHAAQEASLAEKVKPSGRPLQDDFRMASGCLEG
jgi:hypothetical protein